MPLFQSSMPNAERLIQIYHEANSRRDAAERARFIAGACQNDPELGEQVRSLLESDENAGDFLENPVLPSLVFITEKLGDTIGRYKLLERIGEGGCGVVYVAEQVEPVRRRIALKVIKLGMDTKQVIARFESERQALAMMEHPNIARVLDAGSTETGRPFFVMELVRGLPITEFCAENELSIHERLGLFINLCLAIQHAHQMGIIHRDIKPSNILVTLHDGVPVPKVIDFGIAKATEGRLSDGTVYTQFLHFVGTPAYLSPEQAEMSGLDIDTRSDIYSLGVVLYELLTGSTPFDGQKMVASGIDQMRKTIRESEPARPSTRLSALNLNRSLNPAPNLSSQFAIDPDLDWIVMKCLEKDRSRRYDTANGLALDLQRHLSNEPVLARPPTTAYKLQKAWRRNKIVLSSASAVAAALVIGTSVSLWQLFEARKEGDKARIAQKAENDALQQANYNLYVAKINLAGQAWEHHNIERLRELLSQTRSFPERGFEWYYWQRQAHLRLAELSGHLSTIDSVVFSPDGRHVLTGSHDKTARVWDAATGQELFRLIGHTAGIASAAFSPDGKFIATGSDDETVRVWDVATHEQVYKHVGHKTGVTSVAFSPDGSRIASSSYDGTAKIWEARSDRTPLNFPGHMAQVHSVAFSPRGERIVTTGSDKTARIWDSTTAREILKLERDLNGVITAKFSPDGLRVLTGGINSSPQLWDAATGSNLVTFPYVGPVCSVDFSSTGARVVTGSWDSFATLWDAQTGRKLRTIGADAMAVRSVAFSPENDRIVTGGGEGTARVWDATDERESLVLRGNASPVLTVALSPDGGRIVTAGAQRDELEVSRLESAQLWDRTTGKKTFTLDGHTAGISAAAFSPDGRLIATASGDQTARLWAADTGKPIATFSGHTGTVYAVAFSPDSRRIVTGGKDHAARIWDVTTRTQIFELSGHLMSVRAVAFSPDGRSLATADWDGIVTIWNADTGDRPHHFEHPHLKRCLHVAFSPDGRRLIACGWPRTAVVWDVQSHENVELRGHVSPVGSAAFSPDGKRIVTAGWDMRAKLWDAQTARELLSVKDSEDAVSSVAFSPDGQWIVAGSWDKTARILEIARMEQVAAWDAEEREAAQSRERWQEELDALLHGRAVNRAD